MSFNNLFEINNNINLKNRTSNKVLKILLLVVSILLITIGYSTISSVLSTNADVVIYPVAMMRTSSSSDSYAYKNTTYRDNIKTLTFEREIDIPSEALASWDVSANSDESVMAYVVTNSEDDTKYDLYIEADGDIYANFNSSYLFADLRGLETINNIDYLNTSKVTNMSSMFSWAGYNATTWDIGDLSSWNTSSVTIMSGMFECTGYNATTWDIGDLSSWNTSSVTSISYMFYCAGYKATTWDIGDLSSWNTSSVISMAFMFGHAGYNATTWDIGDLSSWNTSSVINMTYMFGDAGYNATTWDIGDLSSWNTSSVTDMSYMFYCAGYNVTTWDIGDLSSWSTSSVTDMSRMFYCAGYNSSIIDINLSSWNLSNVTDISWIIAYFGYNATSWSIGDISNWTVSNVTNMKGVFAGTPDVANINISNWNTSSVTNMASMFFDSKLSSSDLNNIILYLNTSNVTDMSGMFGEISVNSLNLNGLDVSKVTDMSGMFYGCSNLTQIDISSWYTDNLVKTYGIVYITQNNTTYIGMFQDCPNLTTIYVGDGWNMSNVTNSSSMFKYSTHLVGGNGTTYDANHIDKEYARVDETGNPGYLTYKSPFTSESWSTIASNVVSGNTSKYHVGDTKCIALNGFTTTNDNGCEDGNFLVRIANMSSPSECENEGFSQSACGFVIEFVDVISINVMNSEGTYGGVNYDTGWNIGGWPASKMYKYINPVDGNASSGTIYKALPSDLKNAIIDTYTISGRGSSGSGKYTSTDKLYLFSTAEIWLGGHSKDREISSTRQLDYYNLVTTSSDYTSTIKQYNGTNNKWWLRSAYSERDTIFFDVDYTGSCGYSYANQNDVGVSPAFRIG